MNAAPSGPVPGGDPARAPSLVLVGFMGAGKSRLGALVAARSGIPFADTDSLIEAQAGPIPEIFRRDGEAGFRKAERGVAVAVLEKALTEASVVALGGGAVLSGDVRDALRRVAHVAWLTAPFDVLWGRVSDAASASRPLATDRERFARLLDERSAIYAAVATVRVANDGSRSSDEVATELAALVSSGRTGAPEAGS